MSTDLPVSRFCTFCSLLCEQRSDDRNFGATFCSRRNRELDALRSWSESRDTLASLSACEGVLEDAKRLLARSKDILVTGRMRSVGTSRGALRIAQRHHATLDCWDSDAAFEYINAFQRSGSTTVSLAEARDISELFLVIGGDSLIEDYPRLPSVLSRGVSTPALLLGAWSCEGCKPWLDAGFQVLAIDTPIEDLPRSLSEASRFESMAGWDSQTSRWLHASGYTTAVWSMKHLNVQHGDLWYESMMGWIAHRNETHRVGGLCLCDLESTFHQVCTWWTGFPGRIRCTADGDRYDPTRFSCQRWLDEHRAAPSAVGSLTSDVSTAILWIDDSFDDPPAAVFESGHACIAISPHSLGSHPRTLWLPCQMAGLGSQSEFFRGDHAVLFSGQDPLPLAHDLPSASQWLRGLIEP